MAITECDVSGCDAAGAWFQSVKLCGKHQSEFFKRRGELFAAGVPQNDLLVNGTRDSALEVIFTVIAA